MPEPLNPADLSPAPGGGGTAQSGASQNAPLNPADLSAAPGAETAETAQNPADLTAAPQAPGGQPPQPAQPSAWGDVARGAARGIAKGAAGAVAWPVDLAIEGEHAIDPYIVRGTEAINRATGLNIPIGEQVGTSSDYVEHLMDRFMDRPKTSAGQWTETGTSLLTAGGLAGKGAETLAKLAPGGAALRAGFGAAAQANVPQIFQQIAPQATKITSRAAHRAADAGYKLSPAYIGGKVMRQFQTWRGQPKLHEEISAANEPVTDTLARQDLNQAITDRLGRSDLALTADSEFTEETFEALKQGTHGPWEEARALTPRPQDELVVSKEFGEEVKEAGKRYIAERQGRLGAYPFQALIEPEISRLQVPALNMSEAIGHMQALRQSAREHLLNYDPKGGNALGYVQRKLADALDREIGRMAENPQAYRDPAEFKPEWHSWQGARTGPSMPMPEAPPFNPKPIPGLGDRLKAAREARAKIQDYEDALGAGGHIDAHKLMRINQSGRRKLSGNARLIAETAENFKKDLAPIVGSAKGERGEWSAVDYFYGGLGILRGDAPVKVGLAAARKGFGELPKRRWGQEKMLEGLAKRSQPSQTTRLQHAAGEVRRAAGRGAAIEALHREDPERTRRERAARAHRAELANEELLQERSEPSVAPQRYTDMESDLQ